MSNYLPGVYFLVVEAPGRETIALNFIKLREHNAVVTGIEDDISRHKLSYYPNPTNDFLQVSVLKGNAPYKLFDPRGSLLLSGTVSDHIDVLMLPSGLYLLQVEGHQPIRLIKN